MSSPARSHSFPTGHSLPQGVFFSPPESPPQENLRVLKMPPTPEQRPLTAEDAAALRRQQLQPPSPAGSDDSPSSSEHSSQQEAAAWQVSWPPDHDIHQQPHDDHRQLMLHVCRHAEALSA